MVSLRMCGPNARPSTTQETWQLPRAKSSLSEFRSQKPMKASKACNGLLETKRNVFGFKIKEDITPLISRCSVFRPQPVEKIYLFCYFQAATCRLRSSQTTSKRNQLFQTCKSIKWAFPLNPYISCIWENNYTQRPNRLKTMEPARTHCEVPMFQALGTGCDQSTQSSHPPPSWRGPSGTERL